MKFIQLNEVEELLSDNLTIMFGGFMGNGSPHNLIDVLVDSKINFITAICNDAGLEDYGLGKLIRTEKITKLIASHIGLNPNVAKQMNNNLIDVRLLPQGTLIECIRAGGYGLGAVITPTGVGTPLETPENTITIDNRKYLIEKPLNADLSIIYGTKCDILGNIKYSGTTQNFNTKMTLASEKVIVEVEEKVDYIFDPDEIDMHYSLIDYIYVNKEIR